MLRRLFCPRSERHAYQAMIALVIAALGGIIGMKMILWWGWRAFIPG